MNPKPFLILIFTFVLSNLFAQSPDLKTAIGYLSHVSGQSREITKDYMSYSSAVAHGKSARKVDNRRKELIQSTKTAIYNISKMPPFMGDKSLRDSVVSYLKLSHLVINEDYEKIVNMEEVAEQSYDAMEAYLLAQDIANEKMNAASDRLSEIEKQFAEKNNIKLIESDDELSKKVEKTTLVNKYHRPIYLIFFKSYKQELYLLDALERKDLSAIEQNKMTLKNYADEGILKLKELPSFGSDRALIHSCIQLLEFYKDEASTRIDPLTNYLVKEDNFLKIKKSFEAKRENERTKEDVDLYNKAIKDINNAGAQYNGTNKYLNDQRNKHLNNYNKASQTFFDTYVPKYR